MNELRTAVKRFRKGFKCEEQGRIALAYYEGEPRDVLGIMPTGMGKSLCYCCRPTCGRVTKEKRSPSWCHPSSHSCRIKSTRQTG